MRSWNGRQAAWGGAILALALVLRLAAGAWWQARLPAGRQFGFADSESYWRLGQSLARGEPFVFRSQDEVDYHIFRTPGYPWLLAQLMRVAGTDCDVRLARAQAAQLGVFAVLAVMLLAWRFFDVPTALVAGLAAAVYPEAIALSTFVLSEAPFTPLLVAQLCCWREASAHGCPRHQVGWGFFAGVAAGLATLMRPSWLLFTPFALGVLWSLGPQRRRTVLLGTAMLAGLALTLAPWWVRNYAVSGRLVPTTLQVGASLYDGLSPSATGGSDMRFVSGFVAAQRAADAETPPPPSELFEDRLDRRLRDAALAWAGAHPGRALALAGVKLVRMWRPLPNAEEFQSRTLGLVLAATYLPALVLAAAGFVLTARTRGAEAAVPASESSGPSGRELLLLLLPAIYLTCLHVIFVSSLRYRQPAMLPLLVLSAAGAGQLVCLCFAKRRPISPEPV